MKVPNNIKIAIQKCAEHYSIASAYEREITDWMEKKKITENSCDSPLDNLDDEFIDCCIQAFAPNQFIKRLEEFEYEK